jgi:hypothetical protein
VFSIEVNSATAEAMIDAVQIAIAPYSLNDWMRTQASPLLGHSIIDQFADFGINGNWPDLAPVTVAIKEYLGVPYPEAPLRRSEDMKMAFATDHDISLLPDGVELRAPGDISDPILRKKIEFAQRGGVNTQNQLMPGSKTPPRPITLGPDDAAMLMVSLEVHIMNTVAMMMGARAPRALVGP